MVDYSRFDHIGSDSDSGDESAAVTSAEGVGAGKPVAVGPATLRNPTSSESHPTAAAGVALPHPAGRDGNGSDSNREQVTGGRGGGGGGSVPQPTMMTMSKKGKEGRIKFEHEGRAVYEWEQSMEEVNLYIETPPGVKADRIDCKITPGHLRLGLKGNPPFLDEDTGGSVVVEESYWMMDGGELNVNLQKMKKAETWASALQGRNTRVDPMTLEGMQKKIMLERFQSENPGFDFSGAEFNGEVPDARSFMGGVKYA